MKGEIYYREKYPKELRIQIENEDEFKLLQLIFNDDSKGILQRYKAKDLENIKRTNAWKLAYIKRAEKADGVEDTPYSTYPVFEALEEEAYHMEILEDASHV